MNINERMQEIVDEMYGGNKAAFSKAIGVAPTSMSNYLSKERSSKPSSDIVEKIIKATGVSAEWFLLGEGSRMKEKEELKPEPPTQTNSRDRGNFKSIPIVDISAAAGVCGHENPDYLDVTDTIDLPYSMVRRNGTYYCIRIRGESMAPTMLDSGYVVVRLLDRGEWEYMQSGLVYVITTREGMSYVKRIKNRLGERGFIVCMSDNPDKTRFSNFNLLTQELNNIFYVEWYFTAKMPNIHETYYKKVEDLEIKYEIMNEQMQAMRKKMG